MDPNATLAEIRELLATMNTPWDTGNATYQENLEGHYAAADELRLRVEALDEWLTKGGFPPTDWRTWATAFPRR